MPYSNSILVRASLGLLLFTAFYLPGLGQNVIKLDSTKFYRFYSASNPMDEQFNSSITNLTQLPLALRWTVVTGPNWPADWDVYVADQSLTFVPNISTSPIPTELMPEDSSVYFGSGIFYNNSPGCGEYQVIISDYNQDSIIYDTIFYSLNVNDPSCTLTAIDPALEVSFRLFPNPVADYFEVQSPARYTGLKCFDLMGRELYSWSRTPSERYDISALPKGHYWIYFFTDEGRSNAQKIVKD